MDQVFGAEMKRMENKIRINSLKNKIKKTIKRIHALSGLKCVRIDFSAVNSVQERIGLELFEYFSWNRVFTQQQASWKEYFHSFYDLIVVDYEKDHLGNVLLARTVVQYHNILAEPKLIEYKDCMYPIIASIKSLFETLKFEQKLISKGLENIEEVIRDTQKTTTSMQYETLALKRELRELEEDNKKYLKIAQWSVANNNIS
jgi:hypothetical protein